MKLPYTYAFHIIHIHNYSSTHSPSPPPGDFNIKPGSSQYRLLTTGTLETTHPDYPVIVDDWTPKVTPLRSAYKEHDGQEPDFTNYAKVSIDDVLCIVYGIWCMEYGVCCMVYDVWCRVYRL
ncbi:hypothetical protein EON63_06100 [archaeon]|nr:MAG: hypothetical protein EON63_06100 [archaeon]